MGADYEFPALAIWLSWMNNTTEASARELTSAVLSFDNPKRGSVAFNRCESPAERLFLLSLILDTEEQLRVIWDHEPDADIPGHRVGVVGFGGHPESRLQLFQQVTIGQFRVDFLFPQRMIVVEIDGHSFHDRTKEQAASDRQRDRLLLSLGYRVVRFTASEVHRDPAAAMAECIELALGRPTHSGQLEAGAER